MAAGAVLAEIRGPRLVVDTSALLAATDTSAPEHQACSELLATFDGSLIVVATVVAEAAWMIQARCGYAAEAAFVASVIEGDFTVVDLDVSDYRRCLELMVSYPRLSLGLVDASIVTVAEHAHCDQLASLNSRDFYAVRPKHCDGFVLLPEGIERPH
jgi:uncharacterized protein